MFCSLGNTQQQRQRTKENGAPDAARLCRVVSSPRLRPRGQRSAPDLLQASVLSLRSHLRSDGAPRGSQPRLPDTTARPRRALTPGLRCRRSPPRARTHQVRCPARVPYAIRVAPAPAAPPAPLPGASPAPPDVTVGPTRGRHRGRGAPSLLPFAVPSLPPLARPPHDS